MFFFLETISGSSIPSKNFAYWAQDCPFKLHQAYKETSHLKKLKKDPAGFVENLLGTSGLCCPTPKKKKKFEYWVKLAHA